MNAPSLSVVIATIGSEYLQKIVDVYLHSSTDVELIIVFDNPVASLESYLSPYQISDPRVKIEINIANLGIARTTNIGIRMSTGSIIVRNDDDDIPSSNRLNEISKAFSHHPDIDIVFSYAQGFDTSTQKEWIIRGPVEHTSILNSLLKRNFIVHSTVAFRRESLEKIGCYDETFDFAVDYAIYLRAIRAGLVFRGIPEVLVTRIYHANSITVAKRKRQILHSFAARLLHLAQSLEDPSPWVVIARYAFLLVVPNWARRLRRKMGFGR